MAKKGRNKVKKPLIQRYKIRKYLNKYLRKRLSQYDIKYNSPQFNQVVDNIEHHLKQVQEVGGNEPKDYRSTVKNVIFWGNQLLPYEHKSTKVEPPKPYVDEKWNEPFHYFELAQFFEGLLPVTNDLYFYSDTIYYGNIKSGEKESQYDEFIGIIKEFIIFMNHVQKEIIVQLGDYDYEVKCIVRWRRSDGKGSYYDVDKPYWHRKLKRWQLEVMLCDEDGNKIFLPEWKIPRITSDGELESEFTFDEENESKDIAEIYTGEEIFGEKDKKVEIEEEELIEEEPTKLTEQPTPEIEKLKIQKDKEVEIAKVKSEQEIKEKEISSSEKIKLQKLADLKSFFERKMITLDEYMSAIEKVK